MSSREDNQQTLFRPRFIIFYIGILLLLAVPSGTSPLRVFIGTTPLFFQIIILAFVTAGTSAHRYILLGTPFILSIGFFLIGTQTQTSTIAQMDIGALFAFNLLISLLLIAYAYTLSQKRRTNRRRPIKKQAPKQVQPSQPIRYKETIVDLSEAKKRQYESTIETLSDQLRNAEHQLTMTQQTMHQSLQSIEEKCKGINFVIGRVYSDKKGGSPEIRDHLKIPRELYNTFSEIATHLDSERKDDFLAVLYQLKRYLTRLEEQEKNHLKIGGADHPSIRNRDGSSRIIDVLSENDKDPVKEYHTQAKEICSELIEFFAQ